MTNFFIKIFWLPQCLILWTKYLKSVREAKKIDENVKRVTWNMFWGIAAIQYNTVSMVGTAPVIISENWPIEVNQAIVWVSIKVLPK